MTFLSEFSRIVYRPLLLLVFHGGAEMNTLWNVTKFNRCIPVQPSREELADNGRGYLRKIEQLFDNAVSSLHMPDDFTVEGLTPENAYLHIQGHQLYNLVRHIGSLLCRGTHVAFTSEILNTARQTSGYEEIDSVQSDLKTIIS